MKPALSLAVLLALLATAPAVIAQNATPASSRTIPPSAPAAADGAASAVPLTRAQAEELALRVNPEITAGHLLALAQAQVTRETRSAELPQLGGVATAMQAEDASRISAGGLTSSRLYTHAGAGATLSQLITDFGHTPNLVAFARLTAKAQDATARATEQDILLATDQAFYNSLEAQALVRVAEQTVKTRQDNSNLISQLTANKLKSDLDLSIAEADLSQSQLLLLDAESNRDTANSVLVALFNAQPGTLYAPVDDTVDNPAPPPAELDPLMSVALKQRPDYLASTLSQLAAEKFSKSQHEQYFPTISALGTAGFTPVRPDGVYVPNWFGAIGVNLSVPIFTGFRITAQAQEADLRAKAAAQQSLNLKNNIQRDVTTAFLQAKTAFQRVGVADQFAQHATQALSLAQARYQLGLSSIVELSQSQLQQTQAAVSAVNARYQYQLSLAALNYQAGYTP